MSSKMTFVITLFVCFTAAAADLATAWNCDEDHTEIFWCEKVSGPHDFARMSYCYKTDSIGTQSVMPQLVMVRENEDQLEDFIREVSKFEKVTDEGSGAQRNVLIHFESQIIKTDATEVSWSGKYTKYRFGSRLATDNRKEDFTHYVYATNHQVEANKLADGRWSKTDVGFGYGDQNLPNLMKCYTPTKE